MAAEPLPHDRSDAAAEAESALWSARPGGARRADRQGRVVQSMARKVTRPCRRNGCPAPARASMVLDYAGKCVTLVPLLAEADPRFLEVCPTHAASMDVPRGWDLVDERDDVEEPTGPPTAREMGSSATVAVLAEALRHDPDVGDEPGDEDDGPGESVEDQPSPVRSVVDVIIGREVDPDGPAFDDDAPAAEDPAAEDPAAEDAAPGVPRPEPTPPSGRISQPGTPSGRDRRQLRLDDDAPRGPRPVPAALDD